MEVGKKTILNQFIGGNNSTQFVIPIYQRNYVWEKKNIEQLLMDIEKMIPFKDKEEKFHFFGSIVYIDTLHKGSFNEWTIIDGQQRLTTIFLLLQALKEIYPENTKIISKKYLENDEDIINSNKEFDRYRLKPLVSDDNVYLKIARNNMDELTVSEKNSHIFKAYNIIKTILIQWKTKYSIEDILVALDKFKVVWVQLEKNEEPQQVFESINSTGVNLTAADLIRNFVLMNKDNDTQTNLYNNYWKLIEFKYVGTKNLKEFFRFFVSIKELSTIPEKEVYERFKNEYNKSLTDFSDDEILKSITNYAKYYYHITTCIDDPEIEEALKDYRNAKSNMPHIILLETFRLFEENKISKMDVIKTIQLLTNYIIRRNISGVDTKSISNAFGSFLKRILNYFQVDKLNYFDAVLRTIVGDTRLTNQFMPNDRYILEEFKKSNLYSRESVSFILKKIENNESHITYHNLNIEHVMPQSSTSYWETKINDNSTYEEVVNRIGNLTLVDFRDNSSMSNHTFESKKEILLKAKHIKLNEAILKKEFWNEHEIQMRSQELYNQFIEIFPYPKVDDIDSYLHLNLVEENIDLIQSTLSNTLPLEIKFNDENNTNVSTWSDVLVYFLQKAYQLNSDHFMTVCDKIFDEYNYSNKQICSEKETLRTPIEFVDGLFCETNTNTSHKLNMMQRIIKNMDEEILCEITYMNKNN